MCVPINTAPQRRVTYEFLMGYHACGVQNPQDFIFLSYDVLGIIAFYMNAHKLFSICGYSFQNGLGFQRDGFSLWLWVIQ